VEVAPAVGKWRLLVSDQAKLVSLVSFAIQQFLQLLDPFLPQNLQAKPSVKKAVMGTFSVVLGLILVILTDHKLEVLGTGPGFLNTVVSALVVGAGTEASNTVQKLLSYTKDKIKGAAGGAPVA